MEVTHIHWSGKPVIGGIERHLDSLVKELNKKDCKSRLICGIGNQYKHQIIATGLRPNYLLDAEDLYQRNSRIIDRSDIIHFHNGHVISPEKTGILFELLKKKNKKLILSIHNIDDCKMSKEIIKLPFDSYITYSEFMKRTVSEVFNVESINLPCYLNLCASNDFNGSYLVNSIKILQPTRFSRWKGSYVSLEAVTELLNENQNIIFSHGGCKNLLFDKLRIPDEALKWVKKRKIFLREYSFDEITDAIKSADIILHPTLGIGRYGEPFSLACLEAMIYGKPIIASKSGFIPDLLKNYSRKQLVEVGNINEVYHALKRWITQPIPNLSSKDRELSNFWKSYINSGLSEHLKLYSKILTG